MFYPYQGFNFPLQPIPQQQQQNVPQMQFVQNKDSVNQFQIPNNCSAVFFDQNDMKFYVKTTDASGSATIKTFDYKESANANCETEQFVSKTEFEQLKKQMEEMRNMLNERHADVDRNDRSGKR